MVWETRERLWPPLEVCKEITRGGIHVIPKSSHKSASTTQWKYTFAIAEQRLAHLFTPTQRACYLILKQLKRKYFSQVSLNEGQVIITSGISIVLPCILQLQFKQVSQCGYASDLDCHTGLVFGCGQNLLTIEEQGHFLHCGG